MKCPCCKIETVSTPGIGECCVNPDCHIVDGLEGFVVEFKGKWYIHPRRLNGTSGNWKKDEKV